MYLKGAPYDSCDVELDPVSNFWTVLPSLCSWKGLSSDAGIQIHLCGRPIMVQARVTRVYRTSVCFQLSVLFSVVAVLWANVLQVTHKENNTEDSQLAILISAQDECTYHQFQEHGSRQQVYGDNGMSGDSSIAKIKQHSYLVYCKSIVINIAAIAHRFNPDAEAVSHD